MSLRRIATALVAVLLIQASGCGRGAVEVIHETDERQYQLAKEFQKQGKHEEALAAYLRVIEKRPGNAPESHFEAGHIFLEDLGDPVRAIYHFDRFLELEPESPHAGRIEQMRTTAEKEFARSLPAQPFEGQLQREELLDMVSEQTRENARLRQTIADLRARLGQGSGAATAAAAPATASPRPATPVQPGPTTVPETYTVRSGDTLTSISRRVYGTPSRWMDIFQANRDRLSSQDALRVGQELLIP